MGRTINGTNNAERIEQGTETALRIFAKGGNDTIILNRGDDLGGLNFVDAGDGNDAVVNVKEHGNEINLGNGDDTYVGTGFGSFSADRADIVRAGTGNDTIAVSTFKSQYFGDSGNDTFFSEGWQNVFNGGTGTDTISYEPRSDNASLGAVTINLLDGFALTGANRRETLISIENATGSEKSDIVVGSNGANVLKGLAGNDQMDGLGGNDILHGGRGADYLLGGAGADTFDYNHIAESTANSLRDVIGDFSRSQGDRIDLRDIDADTTHSGNQAFEFIGTAAFSREAGELRFQNGIVSGDTNGDGRADFQIALEDITSMRAGDFLL